jgi:hypothetical protein
MSISKFITRYLLFAMTALFFVTSGSSQAEKLHPHDSSEVAGNWKGSSICQVKNSPCQDETVVYNILKADAGIYQVTMSKIVKGKIDFMGVIDFAYDETTKTLSSIDNGRIWQFTMKYTTMDGILIWHDQLYRKVHLEKE